MEGKLNVGQLIERDPLAEPVSVVTDACKAQIALQYGVVFVGRGVITKAKCAIF